MRKVFFILTVFIIWILLISCSEKASNIDWTDKALDMGDYCSKFACGSW